MALQKLGHPEGEPIGYCQNARCHHHAANSGFMLDGRNGGRGQGGRHYSFFQLYVNPNRKLCEEIRGIRGICCKAMFIARPSQLGRRERDMRNKAGSGSTKVQAKQDAGIKKDKGTSAALTSFMDPALCWDDNAWFQIYPLWT